MATEVLMQDLTATRVAVATEVLVDVAVPVLDEEADLEGNVRRLHAHLRRGFPWAARITVVDNGSTDRTPQIARRLEAELPDVRALRLERKGRGYALRCAWSLSEAPVLAYMDVDLSTGLDALQPLLAPLFADEADVAIGSRLAPGARVVRGARREVISRCYNLLLRNTLQTRVHDAQCGFKAITAAAAHTLLPHVHDESWFFDTELLVQARRRGLRIHELPVQWVDDPDSRVAIVPTAIADLRGVWRLLRHD